MWTYIWQYSVPALIGAIVSVASVLIATKVKNRQVDKDHDAALRNSLMNERKELVSEIRDLQKRCDALEKENREQAMEMLELRTTNQRLTDELNCLKRVIPNEELQNIERA